NFILFNQHFYLNHKIIQNPKNPPFVPNIPSQISQSNLIQNLLINQLPISIFPATIPQLLNHHLKIVHLQNAHTTSDLPVL
ncbi:type 2 periplasmic-binding domain-containing protein, partial [Staphylococcus epidermidis]